MEGEGHTSAPLVRCLLRLEPKGQAEGANGVPGTQGSAQGVRLAGHSQQHAGTHTGVCALGLLGARAGDLLSRYPPLQQAQCHAHPAMRRAPRIHAQAHVAPCMVGAHAERARVKPRSLLWVRPWRPPHRPRFAPPPLSSSLMSQCDAAPHLVARACCMPTSQAHPSRPSPPGVVTTRQAPAPGLVATYPGLGFLGVPCRSRGTGGQVRGPPCNFIPCCRSQPGTTSAGCITTSVAGPQPRPRSSPPPPQMPSWCQCTHPSSTPQPQQLRPRSSPPPPTRSPAAG